jgi:GR25 family glycosyltransferase involved in LPS biosynthesis/glycosyltransferase involved in cell wall biosynthesis
MSDFSAAPPARLFTAFGTVLYVDAASGQLRHGEATTSPVNTFFVPYQGTAGPCRQGQFIHDTGASRQPIVLLPDGHLSASQSSDNTEQDAPVSLELIPLERGLIGLRANNHFLSAIPDGRIMLSGPKCSTWELFLASEGWCTEPAHTSEQPLSDTTGANFDQKRIKDYIVHPTLRVRAATKPKAKKVLIYGYPKWSHGRVYYDLCVHLQRRGYIVDILDWQVNHADYIKQIIPYYDLFMTACDGVRTLVDSYGVPYEKIIVVSHHEFDIRMLIEQKGIEVFGRFANFGVVSESLYSASLVLGVQRAPMVAPLGINYSEFYGEISEQLETVGYAGSMSVKTYGVEWKRGALAEGTAREAGLAFKVAGWTGDQISFHDMPDFYRTVDALLITSISEGAGLPAMEGAAAGRLVIGTPVGHFPQKAYEGGGIIAPIEPEKFKAFATAKLQYYKKHPAGYVAKCRSTQETARKFDWQYSIGDWIELIESAAGCSGAECNQGTMRAPFQTDHLERDYPQNIQTTYEIPSMVPADDRSSSKTVNGADQTKGETAVAGDKRTPHPEPMLQQIHLINLDRSTARLATFLERNAHLNDIVRVPAVDGAVVDKRQLVSEGLITETLGYTPGSLGCALSHVRLWQKAVSENRVVTIFEDDAVCSINFLEESARIRSMMSDEWDIIHWGGTFHPLFMWLDFGFAKAKMQFYDRSFETDRAGFQSTKYSPSPIRIAHSFGLQAYSVSPKGARILLEYCLPLRNRIIPFPGTEVRLNDTGIDCPMCGAYGLMQAFVCIPPLVIHDDEQTSNRIEIDQRTSERV